MIKLKVVEPAVTLEWLLGYKGLALFQNTTELWGFARSSGKSGSVKQRIQKILSFASVASKIRSWDTICLRNAYQRWFGVIAPHITHDAYLPLHALGHPDIEI
jgi:hypothetical protein